jgi:signal transduction histidine kinase
MRIPLRLRLTLAFAGGMAVVLAGLGGFVYLRLGVELLRGIDLELRSRADVVTTALGRPGPLPLDGRQGLLDPDEAFAQILTPGGRVVATTAAVAKAPMLPPGVLRSVDRPTFLSRPVPGVDDPARVLAVPTRAAGGPVVVAVGATLGDRHEALDRLLLLLALGGPAALALSSAAGWLLAGAALRPVEQALEREHRFVDDASHELRTPLAILKAELDLAVARPRSRDELEGTVRAAAAETDRIVRLAEDLLVLARMRKGRLPLRRDLLEQAAAPFRPRAAAAGRRIEVAASGEPVRVDPARVRQALHNLLDNALRHGGGPVTVRAARWRDGVRVEVADRGPGFPEALLARAFEPFTRGPLAAQEEPGAGLGLAIVAAIASAHGGAATAANRDGGGARVELLLDGDGRPAAGSPGA